MVNQLKRKRSGSPVALIRRPAGRGKQDKSHLEGLSRAVNRARVTEKASMVEEPASTEKVLTTTHPEAAGTAPVASGPKAVDTSLPASWPEGSSQAPETEKKADTERAASSDSSDAEDVLEILEISVPQQDPTYYDCIKGIQKEHSGIRSFAVKSKKRKQVPTSDPEDVRRLARFAPYLNFLEFKLEMNHRIFKESKVAATLALLNTPGFYFPADIAERAARLVAKWEDEDWSEPEDQPVTQQQAPAPAPAMNGTASNNNNANEEAPAVQIRVPSARDPLFGTNGIMHGVISTRNGAGRRVYMLNPRLPHQSSKEFGHNGLSVGQWFPMRLVALHHGAHGASQAGIYGSQKTGGAFSIVAGNSIYHAFDQDQGDVLYYSAPRAHENKDPNRLASPASSGSLALRASHSSQRPVREKKNASGGLYEQFKLVRLGANANGQETLQEIARSSPSAAQAAAHRNWMDRD
ncbi:hypothetical protein PG997_000859 [Apiospora hydei]|uniref:YDG domain-containing protein n=1 Tax=Apiospora hydei TaxID=1337664 RepID=A0ABR1XC49_9PEZI